MISTDDSLWSSKDTCRLECNWKNSKLKLSRGNIKKETVLIAKVKAHYKAAGVPIPKDIVRSVTEALRKIHNAAATKVNNAVASAAR